MEEFPYKLPYPRFELENTDPLLVGLLDS
jgi:hypothetical protein